MWELMEEIVVALVGQPNVGKSSLINAISGTHLKVGNFAGVTVEKTQICTFYADTQITIVDLPGIYALNDFTLEEKVTRHFLEHEHYDLILNVLDCTNLERNLVLSTQILNTQHKVLIALNMWDEALKEGLDIDVDMLSKALNTPCIPTSAYSYFNVQKILERLIALHHQTYSAPQITYSPRFEHALSTLAKKLENLESLHHHLLNFRQCAWLLLQGTLNIANDQDRQEALKHCQETKNQLSAHFQETSIPLILNQEALGFCKRLSQQVIQKQDTPEPLKRTQRIDRYLMHPIYGLPIFLALMFLVFSLSFLVGGGLQGYVDSAFAFLGALIKEDANDANLGSLLGDGIIGGVGAVLSFLPLIVVLYLGISLLEATGYMSRVAFLLDGIFHRFGLHGKSFIPLVTGFGCSVPAYMATRTLQNQQERLITLFVIGFMSCSARLPIYVLFVGAFFPDKYASLVLFLIYLLGALTALLMAKFLKLSVFRGREEPFVMEMPKYRMPSAKVVCFSIYTKSLSYLKKAGTYILGGAVLVWFASQYPKDANAMKTYQKERAKIESGALDARQKALALAALQGNLQKITIENSLVGRLGSAMDRVFKPMDFDWRLSISLLTGFMAKEVVVSTLGVLYSLGHPSQNSTLFKKALRESVSVPSAIAFIVFVMFYIPCFAATITFGKEAGGMKFVFYLFVFTTAVAYCFSLIAYYATKFCLGML